MSMLSAAVTRKYFPNSRPWFACAVWLTYALFITHSLSVCFHLFLCVFVCVCLWAHHRTWLWSSVSFIVLDSLPRPSAKVFVNRASCSPASKSWWALWWWEVWYEDHSVFNILFVCFQCKKNYRPVSIEFFFFSQVSFIIICRLIWHLCLLFTCRIS